MTQYIILAFFIGAVFGAVITFAATLFAWHHGKGNDDIHGVQEKS